MCFHEDDFVGEGKSFFQGGVMVGGTRSKQGRCSQPLRSVHPFQSPPTFLGNVCDCLLLIIE